MARIEIGSDWNLITAVADYTGWSTDQVISEAGGMSLDSWEKLCNNAGCETWRVWDSDGQVFVSGTVGRNSPYWRPTSIQRTGNEVGGKISTGITANKVSKEVVEEGGKTITKVKTETLPEATTRAGETAKAGGAITGINTVLGAIMVAEEIGFFAKDISKNWSWWSDLSDSVFSLGNFTGTRIPVSGSVGLDPKYSAGIGEVLVRRFTDSTGQTSYYKSFMKEDNVASYVQAMAEAGYLSENKPIQDLPENGYTTYLGDTITIDYLRYAVAKTNAMSNKISPSRHYKISADVVEGLWSRIEPLISDNDYIDIATVLSNFDYSYIRVSIAKLSDISGKIITSNNLKNWETDRAVSIPFKYIEASIENATDRVSYTITDRTGFRFLVQEDLFLNENASGGVYVQNSYATIQVPTGEDEIEPDPEANTLFIPKGLYSLDEIKQMLQNMYPEWYNNAFDFTNYDPVSDTDVSSTYLPVGVPNVDPYTDLDRLPADYTQPSAQDGTIPADYTEALANLSELIKILIDKIGKIRTPSPTPTPEPNPEPGGLVGGSSNSLWAIYNPTMNEIRGVGSYLWSENIITIIQKFFQNPMDAIISLHMIYATPITGNRQNIKLGYLDTGVSSKIVTKQFTKIDCGTIDIPEYYEDVRDYSPYTSTYIYLPFIGIKQVSTEDIIGCKVNITYNIDVLTGAVLCNVKVTKKGVTQILYTYSGNCSVQIPLTGADRTRLLSGAISGAIQGGAIGGVAGAVVGGTVGGFTGGQSIDRTGSFSSNAGAMGIKKPYIIIDRKEKYDPDDFEVIYGIPSNESVILGGCKGYTRVKEIHIENIPNATIEEKRNIEMLLKQGVTV